MATPSAAGSGLSYSQQGHGPVLALLHGFPMDNRMWLPLCRQFPPDWRVICIDLPGFGQSPLRETFTIQSMAEDVRALLNELGALPCVLGGLSMGGYISLAFARTFPDDLRGLLLADTKAAADTPQATEGRNKMIALAQTGGAKPVAEQMLPRLLAENTLRSRPEVVEQLRQIMEACPAQTIAIASAAMRDRMDYTPDLPSIAIPTLIIVGEHDLPTPLSEAEAMRQKLPQAQLKIIPDAGHMTPMEQPTAVANILREFLASL